MQRDRTTPKRERHTRTYLQTTTTATTLATSRVGGGGGDVLDSANAHAGTGEGTESGLSTGTGGLGAVTCGKIELAGESHTSSLDSEIHTTSGTDLDVQSVDAELLAAGSNVLSGQHGSVGRRLVTVSLDLHTTSDTGDGFATTVVN